MNEVDITGQRFGKVVVLCRAPKPLTASKTQGAFWKCKCNCGRMFVSNGGRIRFGKVKSCGCGRTIDAMIAARRTHGASNTTEYRIWLAMRKRCENPSHRYYEYYGGRGISVAKEWAEFSAFLRDMGPRPSDKHSIDRIDNDKDYGPGNCRWATRVDQANNCSSNRIVTWRDETLTLAQWATKLGVGSRMLQWRLSHGWPVEDALSRPSERGKPLKHRQG